MKIYKFAILTGLGFAILSCSPKNKVAVPVVATQNISNPIPVDSNVIIGKLENGLTYYIRKNVEPNKRAELYLVNKVGSILEDDDQLGLAHFAEHMAFNGTKDFPKNELIDYLQNAGVRFGADLNAYTGFNQTVYQLPLPTDSTALFKKGFDILANWAGYVSFDDKEIDEERGVIIEEDRQRGKNAQERMSKQLLPVLLANSKYAERLPIGKIETLKTFKYETIKRFYNDWYRPNLQAVIAVGDFDIKEVELLIKQNFSDLKNPENERLRENFKIPANKEPLVKIVSDPEFPYNLASIIYKHNEIVEKTEADFVKQIEISLINTMLSDRLTEIIQKGNTPFIVARSNYDSFQGGLVDLDAFTSVVVAKDAVSLKNAVTAVIAENQRMKKFGFTQTELDRAKINVLASVEKQFKEKDKTKSAVFVQDYLQHFLKGSAIPSIDYRYDFYQKNLEKINIESINEFASKMITEENQIAIIQAPEKEKPNLPTNEMFLEWIKTAGNDIEPYVDKVIDKPLLAENPVAGKVISEQDIKNIDVQVLKLSNGVDVILKPTNFKNDQILFSATSKGGTSLAADNDFRSAEIAASLVSSSGIANFDENELGKLLTGKVLQVSPFISDYREGVTGSAAPKDLETALQLMHLYFTQPRKDIKVFDTQLEMIKTVLANRGTDPNSIYQDTISAVLTNYHKRAKVISSEDLAKLSLDKSLAFYKERFSNAGDFVFTFVGNLELDKIKPLLENYIASLPSTADKENFKDLGINPIKGNITKKVYKGLEDKASVTMVYTDNYIYSKSNNLQLNALKSVLDYKILDRLREKESGVYSPRVSLSFDNEPKDEYSIVISFSCAPNNVDKLIAAADDEVNKLKTGGVLASDIQKFKAEKLRQNELRLRENSFWLAYLENSYIEGDNPELVLDYPKTLDAVTIQSVKAAANTYLNKNNLKKFILLPESKK